MKASYDVVFVGSGINSLVGAALLAKAGKRVAILERNDYLGGAIKTAEITRPGFVHEVFSSWHPLFVSSAAYQELAPELGARGLEYLNTELATGTALPDGSSAFLTTSHDRNVEEFARHAKPDGDAWDGIVSTFMPNADLAFGVLTTELWSRDGFGLATKALRRLGRAGLVQFTGELLSTCRDWASESFESDQARALFAPWVLHTGLGPDAASSGFMARVIAIAIELGGMPLPRGGGKALVDALVGIVMDAGGAAEIDTDVEEIVVSGGNAIGVRCAGGTVIRASDAVAANVTPTQLYSRLLARGTVPDATRADAARFRYGRSEMQIHLALDEPPKWRGDEQLGGTAIVHVTPGLDGVSRAVNEAERGLLPAEATIVVGQPVALDPARAPEGKSILWLQLQELPSQPRGDAAGELDVGDGSWTEELREAYADSHPGAACQRDHKSRQRGPRSGGALASRYRAGQHQHGRRRHLRGLLRTRPEPALAPATRSTGSPHGNRQPVSDRRKHASRPRAGRRVGNHRRQGASARERGRPRPRLARVPLGRYV